MAYTIKRPNNFDIAQIFDCGQCFRFGKHSEKSDTYCGVAFGKYLEISQSEDEITFNCDESTFLNHWHNFLDLDNNYSLYIDSFKDTNGDGIGDVPETYGIMQGRKVVEDNKNIWNIIKNPNRYTMIIGAAVLLLAGIVFALGKLIAKKILKNKKS